MMVRKQDSTCDIQNINTYYLPSSVVPNCAHPPVVENCKGHTFKILAS